MVLQFLHFPANKKCSSFLHCLAILMLVKILYVTFLLGQPFCIYSYVWEKKKAHGIGGDKLNSFIFRKGEATHELKRKQINQKEIAEKVSLKQGLLGHDLSSQE